MGGARIYRFADPKEVVGVRHIVKDATILYEFKKLVGIMKRF